MITRQHWILASLASVSGAAAALIVSSFTSGQAGNPAAPPATLTTLNDEKSDSPAAINQLTQTVATLSNTLEDEIAQRQSIERTLDELRAEIASLRADGSDSRVVFDRDEIAAQRAASRADRLTEFGFTSFEQQNYERLQASAQFKAIELDDRARREGWQGSPRYLEELLALARDNNPVRNELGDERYDEYLYATGQANRLVVQSVVPLSPAESAGFQQGDVILSYDGATVFSNSELFSLRSTGTSGQTISVEVVRDGDPVVLNIPRGPMGIMANGENVDPRTNSRTGGP